ncbi:MAG: IS3 family transposase, partial [Anaerolineaceae bacterium]|nr:IS3 family transposase [Anaerolineaceae bacterium]
MCKALGVSRSGFYAWKNRKPSTREQEAQIMIQHIRRIHQKSKKKYGSPRIYAQLRQEGISCRLNRVARLMQKNNIFGERKKHKTRTTNSNHTYPVAPNLLKRDFYAEKPNQKWVSDITYISTQEGWLYLAAVMDLFSRRIIGWHMSSHINTGLVEHSLQMALNQREILPGLLHHSDRGVQYASNQIRQLLQDYQITVSMSRTGNCYDNAVIESFFSTLKCEWIGFQVYPNRIQAKRDIFYFIEAFYNSQRLHSAL